MDSNERLAKLEGQLDIALDRLGKVEKIQEDIHSLTQSIALLAQAVQNMQSTQDALIYRVDSIEKKPAEDMARIKWAIINTVIAMLVGGFLAYLGLNK